MGDIGQTGAPQHECACCTILRRRVRLNRHAASNTYICGVEACAEQCCRRHAGDIEAWAVDARSVATGERQCHGWYASQQAALKKCRKMRASVDAGANRWDDWSVEQCWFGAIEYGENVDADTESGD
jgi:hypothetical protein